MMRKETDRENLRIKYSIYPMSIESWLSMEIPDQFPKLHQWIQNLILSSFVLQEKIILNTKSNQAEHEIAISTRPIFLESSLLTYNH